jgi:PPK2 family polyphosphate:nucleotide phosphotransferase
MRDPVDSPYLVSFDGDFRIGKARTTPPKNAPGEQECVERLAIAVAELDKIHRKINAQASHSILLMFQAMDAAGKDGTIRAVLTGVNPASCEVTSFKRPSAEELGHDFLWRGYKRLPQRGRIGVFNRSWYEDVLVVRVHPELLASEHLKPGADLDKLWDHRYESLRDIEHHLARNDTVILKFFLHVSRDEQKDRLLKRLDEPESHWKFDAGDLEERDRWDDYMHAYQCALRQTSRKAAPWYAIPADDKHFMRMTVAEIVLAAMQSLHPEWPEPTEEFDANLEEFRARLSQPE